ncbi:MAG: hypothetical protein ACLP7P_20315 [Rhodomicrobium sp.]
MRCVVFLPGLFLLSAMPSAFAAMAQNLPSAAYTFNDLAAAYVSGGWHGFAAGAIVTSGLFYFWRRWLSRIVESWRHATNHKATAPP